MRKLLNIFILTITILFLYNTISYAVLDLNEIRGKNNSISAEQYQQEIDNLQETINLRNEKINELIDYIENYNKYENEHSIFSFIIIFIYSIIILIFILWILNESNKNIKFNLKELLICIFFLYIFIYFITGGNVIKTNDKNINYKDYFEITDYQ